MTFDLNEYMRNYYRVEPSETFQHSFGLAQQIVKLESQLRELEGREAVGVLLIKEQYAAYNSYPLVTH